MDLWNRKGICNCEIITLLVEYKHDIYKRRESMIISTAGKTVEVVGNVISIKESITRKQKNISISSVISVQLKKPGLIGGYLHFQTVGGLGNSSMKTVNDPASHVSGYFWDKKSIT